MAFAGRELVDPRGQHLLARIPQPAHRAARAPPVRQVMVHRGALLLRRVARIPVLLQCLFDRFGSVFPQCGLMVFPGVVIVSR